MSTASDMSLAELVTFEWLGVLACVETPNLYRKWGKLRFTQVFTVVAKRERGSLNSPRPQNSAIRTMIFHAGGRTSNNSIELSGGQCTIKVIWPTPAKFRIPIILAYCWSSGNPRTSWSCTFGYNWLFGSGVMAESHHVYAVLWSTFIVFGACCPGEETVSKPNYMPRHGNSSSCRTNGCTKRRSAEYCYTFVFLELSERAHSFDFRLSSSLKAACSEGNDNAASWTTIPLVQTRIMGPNDSIILHFIQQGTALCYSNDTCQRDGLSRHICGQSFVYIDVQVRWETVALIVFCGSTLGCGGRAGAQRIFSNPLLCYVIGSLRKVLKKSCKLRQIKLEEIHDSMPI